MAKKKVTQEQIVLKEMKERKGVTSMDGLRLGIAHIPSVIRNIKKTTPVTATRINKEDGRWYMYYTLTNRGAYGK